MLDFIWDMIKTVFLGLYIYGMFLGIKDCIQESKKKREEKTA